MVRKSLVFLTVLFIVAACAAPAASGPEIHVEDAWARPALIDSDMSEMDDMHDMPMSGTNGAAYFVLMNDGNEADALIGVTSGIADLAEIHQTRIDENNVAQMLPVARVEVPARGTVEFTPGSYHVMLVGLTRDLKVGDTLTLKLQFEKSGEIVVNVPIQLGQ